MNLKNIVKYTPKKKEDNKENPPKETKDKKIKIKKEPKKVDDDKKLKKEKDKKLKEELKANKMKNKEAKRLEKEEYKEKLRKAKEVEKAIKKAEKLKKEKEAADINKLCQDWIKLMAHLGLDNELDETYTLTNIKVEEFGFSCRIRNYTGGNLTKLESDQVVAAIEDNLKCVFVTKKISKTNYVEAKIITQNIKVKDFKPIKLDPWELYLSNDIASQPIITSMIDFPHVIITGATGSGKSKLIDIILTNLINTCDESQVEIFISQVDKVDQIVYRKARTCKAYVKSVEDTLALTNFLDYIVQERNKILEPCVEDKICEQNIKSYNKAVDEKKINGKKWTTLYLVIDEYSTLMPNGENNKNKKQIKEAIQNNMEHLFQIGRSVGVFVILGLQRGTVDKLPPFCKAMAGNTIAFRVNNKKSSEVAIDDDKAASLDVREFILKKNELIYGKSLTITPEIISEYIDSFKVNDFSNLIDLSSYKNEISEDDNNTKKGKRTTKAERKANKKKAMEELVDNIKKQEDEEIRTIIDNENNNAASEEKVDNKDVVVNTKKKKEKVKIQEQKDS